MRTEPGIYADIPMHEYISDPCPEPSVSTTTAHLLLTRSPLHAWWAHPRLGGHAGDDSSRADLGSAAHSALLGGARVVYAPAEFADWRKKEAQAFRDAARSAGDIPLLEANREQIESMVGPARERLAQLGATLYERTILWKDVAWGRSRPDVIDDPADLRLFVDYKTATAAEPSGWIRSCILSGGYDLQAGLALRGADVLLGKAKRDFLFLVQEIEAPYALSVIGLGPEFVDLAARKVDAAMDMWAACLERQAFQSYDERTHYAEPPTYALMAAEAL